MSRACTSGRHGVPSDSTCTSPVSTAWPTRLLSTMSARSRGEKPNAVALRRKTGSNASSASVVHVALDPHLALGVRRHGTQRGVLVHQRPSPGGAVDRAGRGVEEAAHAGLLRGLREAHRGVVVDVVGDLRARGRRAGRWTARPGGRRRRSPRRSAGTTSRRSTCAMRRRIVRRRGAQHAVGEQPGVEPRRPRGRPPAAPATITVPRYPWWPVTRTSS